MAFPQTALPIQVDLQIDGAWTDYTSDVYSRGDIVITRGRTEEAQAVNPGRCTFQLNNRDSKFSPRNPLSPLYGKIGQNTPVRVSVHTGTPYLETPGAPGDAATTPDVAALDITGDTDVRVDVRLFDWEATTPAELCSKWSLLTGQRSWLLFIYQRRIWLYTTSDGATPLMHSSTSKLDVPRDGRLAVRAAIDVNNGASGRTITFYTAPSIGGTWTQLGNPVVVAGTTSIFNSTSPVTVGDGSGGFFSPAAEFFGFELRSGIGGTVVANPNFTTQAVGATSFADAAGRSWSMSGGAAITNRQTRFAGEIPDWPVESDTSGQDVYITVEAAGILRRLGQGRPALDSTLRRRIPSFSPVAYWPMEDGPVSTQSYSPIPGVLPMRLTGFVYGSDDSLPGSSALPAAGASATLIAGVPPTTPGEWQVECVYNLDEMPATLSELLLVRTTGTASRIRVRISPNHVDIQGLDPAGDEVFVANSTAPDFTGAWTRLQIKTQTSGGTVTATVRWITIGGNGLATNATYSGTAGYVTQVSGTYGATLEGLRLGHLAVLTPQSDAPFSGADQGFNGETAGLRMQRLGTEEATPVAARGLTGAQSRLGPQRPEVLVALLQEAADSDHGILHEARERIGLQYLGRGVLENQSPTAVLAYDTDLMPGLMPAADGLASANDVTVTRDGGSSGRAVLEEGRLSVLAPPAGIGPYPDSVSLSLHQDAQAVLHAGWLMHLGTVDEARYPVVNVALHRNPELTSQVMALDSGARMQITGPPARFQPDTIDLLVQGYTETLSQYTWAFAFNCTPASPYTVGVVDDPDVSRADTDGSSLVTDLTSTATTAWVLTDRATEYPRWVDSAGYASHFPFDVSMGGEVVTTTGILNCADTFNRTVAAGSWGTSSSGLVWQTAGGLASDRSVNGSRGVITLAANVSTVRLQELLSAAVGNCEVRVRLSVSAVATGASLVPGVMLRCATAGDYYRARVHFGTGGSMFASVTRDTTQIGASPSLPYTYAANDEFEVRVRLIGHTVQIRVWPVGATEPDVWHHTETVVTNTIATGTVGLVGSAFAGMTLVNAQLRYDQFEVITPQRFTLTRSVNGITKPQTAGTDLRLTQPTITAL
ncbi:hypothetical protein [Streptomyces niveus]|uniref:hypothetical protein n=1 Tax=Streptomyces niveus TaxID=193462 RepID=UPI00084CAF57|nr:hypothetical protein [Streptomyces niveus]